MDAERPSRQNIVAPRFRRAHIDTAAAVCWPRTQSSCSSQLTRAAIVPLCQTADCQTARRCQNAALRRARTANRTRTSAQFPGHAHPVSGASSTPQPQRAPAETTGRTSTPPASHSTARRSSISRLCLHLPASAIAAIAAIAAISADCRHRCLCCHRALAATPARDARSPTPPSIARPR